MTKKDFIEKYAAKTGVSRKAAAEYVDAFLETVEDSLVNEVGVQFVGWGTFEVKRTKERKGRNPNTGEEITIQARNSVSFKAGSALKSKVNV